MSFKHVILRKYLKIREEEDEWTKGRIEKMPKKHAQIKSYLCNMQMSLIYRCTIECGRDWASLTIAQSKHITCATARQARYAKYCTAKKVHRAQSPYAQKRIRTKHPLDSQGKRIVYLEGRIRPSTTTMRIFSHQNTHTRTLLRIRCRFAFLCTYGIGLT